MVRKAAAQHRRSTSASSRYGTRSTRPHSRRWRLGRRRARSGRKRQSSRDAQPRCLGSTPAGGRVSRRLQTTVEGAKARKPQGKPGSAAVQRMRPQGLAYWFLGSQRSRTDNRSMPAACTSRGHQAAGPMGFGLLSHVRLGRPRSNPGPGVEGPGLEVFAHGVTRSLPATRALKGLAGYLENPKRGLEMGEEKEAGKGGAFPARGDHCCQIITPTTRDLRRQWPSPVVLCGAEPDLRCRSKQTFPLPDGARQSNSLFRNEWKHFCVGFIPLTCFF